MATRRSRPYQGPVPRVPVRSAERSAAYGEERRGVSPFRYLLLAVMGVALVVTAYGLFMDRSGAQVPILVSGLVVFGAALVLFSILGLVTAVRAGRAGRAARATGWALVAGIAVIGAALSLGGAIVLALLWNSAGPGR